MVKGSSATDSGGAAKKKRAKKKKAKASANDNGAATAEHKPAPEATEETVQELTAIGRRLRRERERFLKKLGDDERAAYLKLEHEKEKEFVEDSRELIEVEKRIAETRGRFNPKVTEATKRFHEAVEAPHNGTRDQKAAHYEKIVELYQAKQGIEKERADALDPLLTRQGELKTKVRTLFESMDQLRLDFS